jgi:hypothetical protein
MAALARISDKYFYDQPVGSEDFLPILAWLEQLVLKVKTEFVEVLTPIRASIQSLCEPINSYLSETGQLFLSKIQDLLAILVSAFTYVKQKLCS